MSRAWRRRSLLYLTIWTLLTLATAGGWILPTPALGFSAARRSGVLLITAVVPNSSAAQSGLAPGMTLQAVNGHILTGRRRAGDWLRESAVAGEPLTVTVTQAGRTRNLAFRPPTDYQQRSGWVLVIIIFCLYFFSGVYILAYRWDVPSAFWFGWAMVAVGLIESPVALLRWFAVWRFGGWPPGWQAPLMALQLALVGAAALVFSFAAYAVYRSITAAAPGAPASTATPFGRAFIVLLAVSGLCAIAADWAQALLSDPGAWGTVATVTITATWVMLLVGSRWFRRGQWQPANRTQRRQFQFMKWGAYVSFGPALLAGIILALAPNIAWHQGISWLLITVGFFPLIVAYAISREQLFGFSGLLRRSLQYAFFSGGLGVVFLVPLALLGFAASYRQVNHQPAAWFWATFAGAIVLSRSARKPLHDALDRRFFREVYQAEQVLGQLGAKLSQFFQREEMETYFLDRLAAALHPAWAAIYAPPPAATVAASRNGARRERLYLSPHASPGPEPPAELAIEDPLHLPHPHQPGDGPWVMGPADPARAAWGGADVVAPLGYQHEVFGWLLLGPKLSEEPYIKRDLDLLSAAGGQLAQGLANAGLLAEVRRRDRIGQELQMARAVQQRLLPRLLPCTPGLEIAVEYAPAREVGGDYYDAFDLRPGLVALVLADVAGKGFAAALLMANLQALVRAALRSPAPGETPAAALSAQVARINRDLHRSVDDGQFATLFAAVVDSAAGAITYCNAGHELPLYFPAGAETPEARLDRGGMVLGLFPDAAYEAATAPFPPGSWLLIFTDGATDAMNSQEESFSREQLEREARLEIAQSPQNAANAGGWPAPALVPAVGPPHGSSAAPAAAATVARNLRRKIEAFAGSQPQFDDVTLLVVRTAAAEAAHI